MAPEVFDPPLDGDGADTQVLGVSVDLYAPGVVAYELLTGRLPFSGAPRQIMYAHLHKQPPSPRDFRPDLPERIERALLRQLAKDPAERYRSAGEFTAELARAAQEATRQAAEAERVRRERVRLAPPRGDPTVPRPEPSPAAPRRVVTEVTKDPAATSERSGPTVPPAAETNGSRPITLSPGRARPTSRIVTLGAVALALVALAGAGAFRFGLVGASVPTPMPAVAADAAPTSVPTPPAAPLPTATPAVLAVPGAPPAAPAPAIATPVPPTATPSPAQRLEVAQAALDAGDHTRALETLNSIKQIAPETPGLDEALYRTHRDRGRALLVGDDLDGSYAEFGEALKLKPDDPAALDGQKQVILTKDWNRMEAAWGSDDDGAISALEAIMRLAPGLPRRPGARETLRPAARQGRSPAERGRTRRRVPPADAGGGGRPGWERGTPATHPIHPDANSHARARTGPAAAVEAPGPGGPTPARAPAGGPGPTGPGPTGSEAASAGADQDALVLT